MKIYCIIFEKLIRQPQANSGLKEVINMAKKKKITIVVKPDAKYRITTEEEMQNFLHMKRKGASTTQNGKAYKRKEKHHKAYH